ncbi:MAG: acetolactate decarboxylase [Iphinoe sp. HA4291-MV1]|nr:acetolactate decarboxylase [Iphinoe sp. HA4291-MV1]
MKLKQYLWIGLLVMVLILSGLPVYSQQSFYKKVGFQVSTFGALSVGVYDGVATFGDIKQQGDFGLGTIEGLDGELIALDGKFYQVKTNGVAYPVKDEMKTPFAAVTFFRKERTLHLKERMTYELLQQAIDQQLPSKNLPYAIRIQGIFPYLKVRSVPKQKPPYPVLSDVISHSQTIFELRNVQGTLVGFRLPQYFKSMNTAGYHFHLITSDAPKGSRPKGDGAERPLRERKTGGHLLDGEFFNTDAEIEMLHDWHIALPNNASFERATLD